MLLVHVYGPMVTKLAHKTNAACFSTNIRVVNLVLRRTGKKTPL
ncbi:unnamed protein product [Lathyrus sativus]|nr:unnamed protein product [Lathyrus sativus]